jgi:hypothetical protein
VANTSIPATCASADVDAPVVAPVTPSATATPTSRTDSFAMPSFAAKPVQLRGAQPDPDRPVENGDGGRHCARSTHPVLDPVRGLPVVSARKAVGQDGRLQRDHRPAGAHGVGHLGVQLDGPDRTAGSFVTMPMISPAVAS